MYNDKGLMKLLIEVAATIFHPLHTPPNPLSLRLAKKKILEYSGGFLLNFSLDWVIEGGFFHEANW